MSDVEVAVLSRSRRSTAGKRMSVLVGKALDDDAQFWSHSTWKEDKNNDESSDDGSYNVNDEAEENRVDAFDSDFDDSESEEEEGDDDDEEKRAVLEDKATKKKGNYAEPKNIRSAGRNLLRKKKPKRTKAAGTGENAGLVLNIPANFGQTTTIATDGNAAAKDCVSIAPRSTISDISPVGRTRSSPSRRQSPSKTLASFRSRRFITRTARTTTKEKTVDSQHNHKEAERDTARRAKVLALSKKKTGKRKYAQDELLIEAANETEAENERWILGRKRIQQVVEDKKRIESAKAEFKLASRFHSKRGCYNTISFPDMDSVPKLFQKSETPIKRKRDEFCVITGLKARYRDPLTGKSYHNKDAFRELRRRHRAGEPLKQTTYGEQQRRSNTMPKDEENDVMKRRSVHDTKARQQSQITLSSDIFSTAGGVISRSPTPLELQNVQTSRDIGDKPHEMNSDGAVDVDLIHSSVMPIDVMGEISSLNIMKPIDKVDTDTLHNGKSIETLKHLSNGIADSNFNDERDATLVAPKVISPLHVISSTSTEIEHNRLSQISLPPKLALSHANVISVIDPPQLATSANPPTTIPTERRESASPSPSSSSPHLSAQHHVVKAS
eukprot:CAMPEP_0172493506 /NCGR_PEP_ID=MMETSP1066-20121228/24963_1 /TAXON_ID=671091 /ORGANISM="Coscinodiscus wailesii, Strain CCMP2513" /LENGTH=611 /DNA_ID=CAMNT_0013263711 /DNA_START=475 /DNA_END=2310 /DNA_ORIENTATION=+